MGLTETEALVLRSYNLAEADKIVVCLTREGGLVRGVARGSRRIKNRFGAALEPFTLLNLTYYQKENQELVSLRSAEIRKSHFDLLCEPEVLAAVAYMGDLLVEFSPPHQINDTLFRMVTACLDAVAQYPKLFEQVLRYFEIWLLRLEGFLPDLRHCGECGKSLQNTSSVVVSNDLLLLCRSCANGKGEPLSSSAYSRLRATQTKKPQVFAEESRDIPIDVEREIARMTHRMIGRVLERRPHVRPTFQPAGL